MADFKTGGKRVDTRAIQTAEFDIIDFFNVTMEFLFFMDYQFNLFLNIQYK